MRVQLLLIACLGAIAACGPSRDVTVYQATGKPPLPSSVTLTAVAPSSSATVGATVTLTTQCTPAVAGIQVLFADNTDPNGPSGLGSATTDAAGRASVVASPTRQGVFTVTCRAQGRADAGGCTFTVTGT